MASDTTLPTAGSSYGFFDHSPTANLGPFKLDNGDWIRIILRDSTWTQRDPDAPDFGQSYSESTKITIQKSSNQGASWTELSSYSDSDQIDPTYVTAPNFDYVNSSFMLVNACLNKADQQIYILLPETDLRQPRYYFPFPYALARLIKYDPSSDTFSFLSEMPTPIYEHLETGFTHSPFYSRSAGLWFGLPLICAGNAPGEVHAVFIESQDTPFSPPSHTLVGDWLRHYSYYKFSGGSWSAGTPIPDTEVTIGAGSTIVYPNNVICQALSMILCPSGIIRVFFRAARVGSLTLPTADWVTKLVQCEIISGVPSSFTDVMNLTIVDNRGTTISDPYRVVTSITPLVFNRGGVDYIVVGDCSYHLDYAIVGGSFPENPDPISLVMAVAVDTASAVWDKTVITAGIAARWWGYPFVGFEHSPMSFVFDGGELYVFWMEATQRDKFSPNYLYIEGTDLRSSNIWRSKYEWPGLGPAKLFRTNKPAPASVPIVSISTAVAGVRTVVTASPHGINTGGATVHFGTLTSMPNLWATNQTVVAVINPTTFTFLDTSGENPSHTSSGEGDITLETALSGDTVYSAVWAVSADSAMLLRVDFVAMRSADISKWQNVPYQGVDESVVRTVFSKGFPTSAAGFISSGRTLIGPSAGIS